MFRAPILYDLELTVHAQLRLALPGFKRCLTVYPTGNSPTLSPTYANRACGLSILYVEAYNWPRGAAFSVRGCNPLRDDRAWTRIGSNRYGSTVHGASGRLREMTTVNKKVSRLHLSYGCNSLC